MSIYHATISDIRNTTSEVLVNGKETDAPLARGPFKIDATTLKRGLFRDWKLLPASNEYLLFRLSSLVCIVDLFVSWFGVDGRSPVKWTMIC